MHHINLLRFIKKGAALLAAAVICSTTVITTMAADSKYKFSDIDLIVTIPEDLVCFTRSTTNNNSYLEKIGVEDASELRTTMTANNIYLEAVNKDITYEIVITGKPANDALPNFDGTDDSDLNRLFDEYIQSCDNIVNDGVTENVTASAIYEQNGVKYFQTDIKTVSNTMITFYSRKYYTVMQGNVYTFTLQSKSNELNEQMSQQLESIVNSSQYVPVKASILENNVVTELLSTIITIGVPIGILALIVFILDRTKKKSAKRIAEEERELRARYAREEQELKQ